MHLHSCFCPLEARMFMTSTSPLLVPAYRMDGCNESKAALVRVEGDASHTMGSLV